VVVGLVLLTGCDADPGERRPVRPAAAPVVVNPEPVALNVVDVPGLGRVATDQRGHTLYLFAKDVRDPSVSTCAADCAERWPPLLVTGEVGVTGIDPDLVGTVTRPDGRIQVTVGGWPVYTFAQDTEPGQANGQGAQDLWSAVTPQGGAASTRPRVALVAENIPGFGPTLADGNGRTLYLFTNDSKSPPKSTCDGACARRWPPLAAPGAPADLVLTGVDPALVGSVTRADGTEQVTVGGWPVHTYTGDTAPGQTNGHGVGGSWFAIEAAGCKSPAPVRQRMTATAPAPDPPDGSTDY
jgi:predicted lipoprotein with Yx(FWY)xxD motif